MFVPSPDNKNIIGIHGQHTNYKLILMVDYRKKEDPWNAIIAGFFTGGSLAVRGGARAVRNSAIGCAILLAVIEGVGIGFQRMMAENTRLELPPPPPQPAEGNKIAAVA